jgi:hypothetical protein
MRRMTMCKLLATIAALLLALNLPQVLGADSGQQQTAEQPRGSASGCECGKGGKVGTDTALICRLYQCGNFGSFAVYYAMHHPCYDPVSYYGAPGLSVGPCNANPPGDNCTQVTIAKAAATPGTKPAKPKHKFDAGLAKDGFEGVTHGPETVPGVTNEECYIEFSEKPNGGGKALKARAFWSTMDPGEFSESKPYRPISRGVGFEIETIPGEATVVYSGRQVVTIDSDSSRDHQVTVLVNHTGSEWREYNILLKK